MSATDTPAVANARRAAFEFFEMATAFRARAELFAPDWNRAQADRLDAAGKDAVLAVRMFLRRANGPARRLFGLDRPCDLNPPTGGAPL